MNTSYITLVDFTTRGIKLNQMEMGGMQFIGTTSVNFRGNKTLLRFENAMYTGLSQSGFTSPCIALNDMESTNITIQDRAKLLIGRESGTVSGTDLVFLGFETDAYDIQDICLRNLDFEETDNDGYESSVTPQILKSINDNGFKFMILSFDRHESHQQAVIRVLNKYTKTQEYYTIMRDDRHVVCKQVSKKKQIKKCEELIYSLYGLKVKYNQLISDAVYLVKDEHLDMLSELISSTKGCRNTYIDVVDNSDMNHIPELDGFKSLVICGLNPSDIYELNHYKDIPDVYNWNMNDTVLNGIR